MNKTKTLTKTALLFAVCLILSLIENSLPPILPMLPGVKLGLSNVAVMFALLFVGIPQALTIAALKSAFIFFIRGAVAAGLSFAGGMVALLFMILFMKILPKTSLLLLSITGAILHNVTQLAVLTVLYPGVYFWFYLPILVISGIVAGVATALITKVLHAKKFLMLVLSLLMLTSCTSVSRYQMTQYDLFDTVITITGYFESEESFTACVDQLFGELAYDHKLYDIYNTYDHMNNLKTINDSGGRPVVVDKKIIELLKFGKDMYALTDGGMNIAMGRVTSLWKEGIPDAKTLAEAAQHVDMNDILLDEEKSTVTLKDPNMKLDVGAIAKCFAVERAAEKLGANGLIDAGGSVKVLGSNGGKPWKVGINNPHGEGILTVVEAIDTSVVTSAYDKRFFEVDGQKYHHIIDPTTLYPAQHVASVTVVMEDCATADALSTALFTLPYEEGKALIERVEGAKAMWILKSGERKYSELWSWK